MSKVIEIKKLVKTIRGVEVKQPDESGKPESITYGDVIVELLASPNRKGAELMKCWKLAQKLVGMKEKTATIEDDELVLIKKVIDENFLGKDPQTGKQVDRYTSFVIAQVLDYLESVK